MANLPSSSSSNSTWLNFQQDMEQALDAFKSKKQKPDKAWQLLSTALSKHSGLACSPEAWLHAVPSKLPWLMANCISIIVVNHKYHQELRHKAPCQLCRITAQLYVHCGQQQDISVRVTIAKQANDSKVLAVLMVTLNDLRTELLRAEEHACSVADAAAGPVCLVAAGRSRVKSSNAARNAYESLAANLQLAQALLQLFNAISSIWPGEAGVLNAPAGAAAAAAGDAAAGQVLAIIAVAVDQQLVCADFAEQCVRSAVQTTSYRAQRLHSRPGNGLFDSDLQQQSSLSMLLGRALLLWGLQLEGMTAGARLQCNALFSSSSPDSNKLVGDSTPMTSSCSNNNNSSNSSSSTSDASSSPAANRTAVCNSTCSSSSSSSSTGAAAAGPVAAHCWCGSKDLLLSMLRPNVGSISMSDHLWQVAAQAAAEHLPSPQRLLALMQLLLKELKERSWQDYREDDRLGVANLQSNRKLAPLISTLLQAASCWLGNEQQQQQVAAAAIAAADAAATTWESMAGRRSCICLISTGRPEGAYGMYEIDVVPEYVALTTQLLQQMLQLPTKQADQHSSNPGISNSSPVSIGWLQDTGESLLLLLANSVKAAARLSRRQPCSSASWSRVLRPAAAATEAYIRSVTSAAAVAAGGAHSQHLADVMSQLLGAGNMNFAWGPKDHTAGPVTTGDGLVTAFGQTVSRTSTADAQLFALLLSCLKLQELHPVRYLPAAAAETAAAMLKSMSQGGHTVNAAALSATVPWLLVLARGVMTMAKWTAAEVTRYLAEGPEAAAATAAAAASKMGITSAAGSKLHDWYCDIVHLYDTVGDLRGNLRLLTMTEQPDRLSQAAPAAAAAAVTAVKVAQPGLVEFLHQWEQQLLPQVKQAVLLATSLCELSRFAVREMDLSELAPATAAVVEEISAVTGSDVCRIVADRLTIVLSNPLVQQLPQQLEAAGSQLCALLPLSLCCNNPGCVNMSRLSELQLVGGKACVCAGCEMARYCGRECQAAHWQAHKRVCKMIKKSRAAA